jgi:hypothetical protein
MMSDPLIIPDASVLQELPYLNAFIKECEHLLSHSRLAFHSRLVSFKQPSAFMAPPPLISNASSRTHSPRLLRS